MNQYKLFQNKSARTKLCLIPTNQTDYPQDEQEEVDNIQVQIESGKDVFLGAKRVVVFSNQHDLSIKHNVRSE